MRDIAEHIVEALGARHDVVLVTVVGSRGSTPRNAGSQMLVSKAGLVCGTIGGGAIEGHAIRQHALRELVQTLGFRDQNAEVFVIKFRRDRSVLDRLEVSFDRGQRGAEVMGDVRDEGVLVFLHFI